MAATIEDSEEEIKKQYLKDMGFSYAELISEDIDSRPCLTGVYIKQVSSTGKYVIISKYEIDMQNTLEQIEDLVRVRIKVAEDSQCP